MSGAGNVASFCAELLLEKGATVLTLSDSQARFRRWPLGGRARCVLMRMAQHCCPWERGCAARGGGGRRTARPVAEPHPPRATNAEPQGYIYCANGLSKAQLERVGGWAWKGVRFTGAYAGCNCTAAGCWPAAGGACMHPSSRFCPGLQPPTNHGHEECAAVLLLRPQPPSPPT